MVTLKLTDAQAKALWIATGEAMDHDDIVRDMFPDGRERGAAYRAYEKLGDKVAPIIGKDL